MATTDNYKLAQLELTNSANFPVLLNDTLKTIDKGLTLDVGSSTGTGNNYVLNLGSISLSSANKGISFKFWADKDSTGAVTINGTYNLVKANGNPIKNLKRNAPYVITYDGGTSFFLSSGGADESDSTTIGTDGSKVLEGETFIGSDGEIHTGKIPKRGDSTINLGINQTIELPAGYYTKVKATQNVNYHAGGWRPTEYGVYNDYFWEHLDWAYYDKAETQVPIVNVSRALGFNENNVVGNIGGISGSALRYKSGTIPASQVTIINKIYALIDISSYVDFTPISVWGMCGNYYFSICNINGQIKYINYYNASSSSEYRTNMSSIYGQTLNVKQIPVNSGSSGSGSGNSAKQYDTIWYAIG